MSTTLIPPPALGEGEKPQSDPSTGAGGSGPGGRKGDSGGGGRSGGPDSIQRVIQRYKLGTWVGIGGIVMIFAAFTSALVVRKGMGDDWVSLDLPRILWFSTVLLLVSSFTIEIARRRQRERTDPGVRQWLSFTLVLGALFLGTQYWGWRDLAAQGMYLSTNPSSSFFYVLTAAHGLHIFGGVLALSYAVYRVWAPADWITQPAAIEATALYWHFMDGLWVYLFLLLLIWR